jgi:hypothetical protein
MFLITLILILLKSSENKTMHKPPESFSRSPANLHRIPAEILQYPDSVTSKSQMTKHLKSCVKDGRVPDVTVVSGFVSRYGNLHCTDGIKNAMGISTFVPYDSSDDAFKAAHDLHNKDGKRLHCFVLPYGVEIGSHKFLHDRNINTCNPSARHVLIYPSDYLVVTATEFNMIATCQRPINKWQMCGYSAAAEEYDEPDLPDDPLFRIVLCALECIALDCDLSATVRMCCRLYQYCISEIQWAKLAMSQDFHFLSVLLLALLTFPPKITDAHVLATVRGALGDLSHWLINMADDGEDECGDIQVILYFDHDMILSQIYRVHLQLSL